MDFEIDQAEFRNDEFYKQNDIDVLKGVEATSVDAGAKSVSLSNGNTLKYDKLFIATGCRPRRLEVPGGDLKKVIVLKDYDDSKWVITYGDKTKFFFTYYQLFIYFHYQSITIHKTI